MIRVPSGDTSSATMRAPRLPSGFAMSSKNDIGGRNDETEPPPPLVAVELVVEIEEAVHVVGADGADHDAAVVRQRGGFQLLHVRGVPCRLSRRDGHGDTSLR